MILTGKASTRFNQSKKWWFIFLSQDEINLFMYKWFVEKTTIKILLISHSNGKYDWYVSHPYINEVYCSKRNINVNPFTNFNECLIEALTKANEVYNDCDKWSDVHDVKNK